MTVWLRKGVGGSGVTPVILDWQLPLALDLTADKTFESKEFAFPNNVVVVVGLWAMRRRWRRAAMWRWYRRFVDCFALATRRHWNHQIGGTADGNAFIAACRWHLFHKLPSIASPPSIIMTKDWKSLAVVETIKHKCRSGLAEWR